MARSLALQEIVDAAVEHNLPPGEYFALWNDLAVWQLNTLRAVGLRPEHRLLDVGCGAMRLGMGAVEYLEDGHYYGVDAFEPFISLARDLTARAEVTKRYTLLLDADFCFWKLQERFDFAISQSVFTHLSAEQCDDCLAALSKVMAPGGVCLFTYLIGVPKTQGFLYAARHPMQRLAVSDSDWFVRLGERHRARYQPLDVDHPTGQRVACYRWQS